jgi:hypothetical protein
LPAAAAVLLLVADAGAAVVVVLALIGLGAAVAAWALSFHPTPRFLLAALGLHMAGSAHNIA